MSTSLNVNQYSAYGTVAIMPQKSLVPEDTIIKFTATMNPTDATTTYTWKVEGATASAPSANGDTITVTFDKGSPAHISVLATNACTPGGAKDTVNGTAGITVKPNCQDAAIADYLPISKKDTVTGAVGSLSTIQVIPSGSPLDFDYAWYKKPDDVTVLGTADTYAATSTGSYYCVVSPKCIGGNSATSADFEVIIMTIALTSAGTVDRTVCLNTALTPIVFTTVGTSTATVSGLPTGVTGSYSAGTFTINGTPSVSGTYNYTVTLFDGLASGTGTTGTIVVNAPPAQPVAITPSNANPCPGTAGLTYTATYDAAVTSYSWTVPTAAGWSITSGQGTGTITVTAGTGGGNITATPSTGSCAGTAQTLSVSVTTFTQPDPISASLCASGSWTFTLPAATGPATISYQWQESSNNSSWGAAQGTNNTQNYTTPTVSGKMYYRRIATSTGCGSSITSNSASLTITGEPCSASTYSDNTSKYVDITVNTDVNGNGTATNPSSYTRTMRFLTYNLGADPNLTPKQQMGYQLCGTSQEDITVFGGWYQWGRNKSYSSRCGDNNTNPGDFSSAVISSYSNIGTADGTFIIQSSWYSGTWGYILWGTGCAISQQNNPNNCVPSGFPPSPNPLGFTTVNCQNPCPSGWRVPNQHELALLGWENGSYSAVTSDASPSISAATTSTLARSGLYWVRVKAGKVSTTFETAGSSSNVCGWALYTQAAWGSAGASYKDGTLGLYEPGAPEPLMFLPLAGYRAASGAALRYNTGQNGYYWSSQTYDTTPSQAYYMQLAQTSVTVAQAATNRGYGYSVRCIEAGGAIVIDKVN